MNATKRWRGRWRGSEWCSVNKDTRVKCYYIPQLQDRDSKNVGNFGSTYLTLGEANRNDTEVLRVGKETALDNIGIHCGNGEMCFLLSLCFFFFLDLARGLDVEGRGQGE